VVPPQQRGQAAGAMGSEGGKQSVSAMHGGEGLGAAFDCTPVTQEGEGGCGYNPPI